MKKLLVYLFCLISVIASAQVSYTPNDGFGYQYKRLASDSTFSFATGDGAPSLRGGKNDKSALYFDSTAGRFYVFNPKTQLWIGFTSGGTGTVDTIYSVISHTDTLYAITVRTDSIFTTITTSDTIYSITSRTDTLVVNNNFIVPLKDTADYLNPSQGSITFAPLDSNYYGYNGNTWLCFSCAGEFERDGLISGGLVIWDVGYTYTVTAAVYRINGIVYTSPTTQVTLSPADDNDARIDIFYLNTSSAVGVAEGIPATPATEPNIDMSTQLRISSASILPLTTEPTSPTLVIYAEAAGEPTEFVYSDNTAQLNPTSTADPFAGTVSIEGTTVPATAIINFTTSVQQQLGNYSMLNFRIKSKGAWGASRGFSISFLNNGVQVGNAVNFLSGSYAFASGNTTAYQNIGIPLSAFGNISGATVIRFTRSGSGNIIGFFIDNIKLLYQEIISGGTGNRVVLGELPIIATTTGNTTIVSHAPSGVVPGTFVNPTVTVNEYGHITSITNGDSTIMVDTCIGGGGGTVIIDSIFINKSLRLPLSDTTSATKGIGRVIYDTLNNNIYGWDGHEWLPGLSVTGMIEAGANVTITGTGQVQDPYVINSSGGGGGSVNVYAPLIKSGDTISMRYNVLHYGAKGDGREVNDAAITASSATLTSATATFTSADVGKVIVVSGAAASSRPLKTTISAFTNSTTVVLAANATTTTTNTRIFWGTDDTNPIQNAINAAAAGGGGTVYIPLGIYLINGALQSSNSQLYIPTETNTNKNRLHINIQGESPQNIEITGSGIPPGATQGSGFKGVILKSTLTAGATDAAIIGTSLYSPGEFNFNTNTLSVSDISFLVLNNPAGGGPVVGGVNYKNGWRLNCDGIAVSIDTTAYYSVFPVNDISGIETPDNSATEHYTISNCFVNGFRRGITFGEHTALFQAAVMCCYYGLYIKQGGHSSTSLRSSIQWCAYDLYFRGPLFTPPLSLFKISAEWQQIGKWYDDIATIKDSANLGTGAVFYSIGEAGVGINNFRFLKSGGANLYTYADAAGLANLTTPNIFTGGNQSITSSTSSHLIFNNTGSSQMGLSYQRSGVGKWNQVMDMSGNGTNDFGIYDIANAKVRLLFGPSGTVNLGGIASSASTSAIAITNGNDVSFDNSAFNWNATTNALNIASGTLTNATPALSVTGTLSTSTADQTGASIQITSAGSQSQVMTGLKVSLLSGWTGVSSSFGVYAQNQTAGTATDEFGTAQAANYGEYVATTTGTIIGQAGWASGGNRSYGGMFRSIIAKNSATNIGVAGYGLNTGSSPTQIGGYFALVNSTPTFTSAALIANNGSQTSPIILAQDNGANVFQVNDGGTIRFNTYGAGNIVSDASGNLTSSSDERLKDVQGKYTIGLKEVLNLKPIVYKWNTKSKLETKGLYAGFSAQNVKAFIPYGTGTDASGYLTLQDRAIMAALVNAVKELQAEIDELKKRLEAK